MINLNEHYKKWKADKAGNGMTKYNKRQVAILQTFEAFLTEPISRQCFCDVVQLLESVWDFSEE